MSRPGHGSAARTDELFAEITRLTGANRARRDLETERRLLHLRYLAGMGDAEGLDGVPRHVEPSVEPLPERGDGLPIFGSDDLTPARLRAAILRDGCMLVRGLVDRERAVRFAAQIERAFRERDRKRAGQDWDQALYDEFRAEEPFRSPPRTWIEAGGGLLVADSPMLAFELIEMFESVGVPRLMAEYLGEPVALSVDKTTLRKAEPSVEGAWHQDGSFMGSARSLNLWLSLSHCGDDAPGLEVVPRRLHELVPTCSLDALVDRVAGEAEPVRRQNAAIVYPDPAPVVVSQVTAQKAAEDLGTVRPIFEPGDAVLFDELCLHQTASDASMSNPRYAVESWFFGRSGFPGDYAPLALEGGRLVHDAAGAR